MSAGQMRGSAPVGTLDQLDPLEVGAVRILRAWSDGVEGRIGVMRHFVTGLGQDHGQAAIEAFADLARLCARHGRRPLMRHDLECQCLGADESCFANFIAQAADGDPEDAMLIATLLVRADMAPCAAALARDVGLALKRLTLRGASAAAARRSPMH